MRSHIPTPEAAARGARNILEESRKIRERYEEQRRERERQREEGIYQAKMRDAAKSREPYEAPKDDVEGRDWKERSKNLAEGMAKAASDMEEDFKREVESQGAPRDLEGESMPRWERERNKRREAWQNEESFGQAGGQAYGEDPAPGGGHAGDVSPGMPDGPQGDGGGAPDVVYAPGPNEYSTLREGVEGRTHGGRPLERVRVAVLGKPVEVPGKGFRLELAQACDLEGPGCPVTGDPYLHSGRYATKDGRKGVSHKTMYSYEDYGAMKAAWNAEGDSPVFYADLVPEASRDGSVSFRVDTGTLRHPDVPFDRKAHGDHAGEARYREAGDALEREMGRKGMMEDPFPEAGAPATEAPEAGTGGGTPAWDLKLKPKEKSPAAMPGQEKPAAPWAVPLKDLPEAEGPAVPESGGQAAPAGAEGPEPGDGSPAWSLKLTSKEKGKDGKPKQVQVDIPLPMPSAGTGKASPEVSVPEPDGVRGQAETADPSLEAMKAAIPKPPGWEEGKDAPLPLPGMPAPPPGYGEAESAPVWDLKLKPKLDASRFSSAEEAAMAAAIPPPPGWGEDVGADIQFGEAEIGDLSMFDMEM